jgi:tetratricopeptide (TPR) repeat protein
MKEGKGIYRAFGAFAIVFVLAILAAAQGTGRLTGQVLDLQGKPWPDVTVQIKNPQNGQTYNTKTDKDGRYSQIGLAGGVYTVTFIMAESKDNPPVNYAMQYQVKEGEPNSLDVNFKEVSAKSGGPSAEELKKREEEEQKFQGLKQHFEAGIAALNDSRTVRTQMASAPADQKQALQDKINTDCQTAVTELSQAEQAAGPKDVNNHATILGNLGAAQECLNKNQDAADAFQKAIDLKPSGGYYAAMATNLAKAGKIPEANAACDKGVALDATIAALCYKNIGIVLSNTGKMKDAADSLQKAANANPKDAQTWYLLGNAYTGEIDSKQEGDKLIYIIPPGTTEAYQKCIDADPNGPYAAQAKAALDGLAQMSGGESLTVAAKKKKKS